jgi:hypothetical protein
VDEATRSTAKKFLVVSSFWRVCIALALVDPSRHEAFGRVQRCGNAERLDTFWLVGRRFLNFLHRFLSDFSLSIILCLSGSFLPASLGDAIPPVGITLG